MTPILGRLYSIVSFGSSVMVPRSDCSTIGQFVGGEAPPPVSMRPPMCCWSSFHVLPFNVPSHVMPQWPWCYRSRVRWARIAVAVGLLTACSTSNPSAFDESSDADATELPGIEMATVPAGLKVGLIGDSDNADSRPTLAPGVGESRWITYEIGGPPPGGVRVHGFALIVTRAPIPFDRGDTRALTVAGQPAQLGPRYLGDGVTALALVVSRWPDAVVEIRASDASMTSEELVAVAGSLRSLTLAEWQTRLKEFGFASRDATSDPQSTRIDLGEQQQGTTKWQASVLIPPGFKTNSADQRQACLQVVFDAVTLPENNCGDPWTIRLVTGTRFMFGITGDGVDTVTIRSAAVPGVNIVAPFEQRVPTSTVMKGVRAYVAVVPAEQCYFTIDGSDRWSVKAIIRPLHHPQFEDACALTGPPRAPSTAPGPSPASTTPR